jgi:SAM-dependent methyltransferase
MNNISIITNFPDASSSPDFMFPIGATQDNHSNPVYLDELKRISNNDKFSYLDLGCAGGQSVVDLYERGHTSCGVEGSNLYLMLNHSIHGVGDNWKKYKDICLFKSDITKEFKLVVTDTQEIQKFDIISAWDVLEHPKPEQIPTVIDNIDFHLKEGGLFICLIDHVPSPHHQCVQSEEWWLDIFYKNGFENIGFDFNASPRTTTNPFISQAPFLPDTPNDHAYGFIFKKMR